METIMAMYIVGMCATVLSFIAGFAIGHNPPVQKKRPVVWSPHISTNEAMPQSVTTTNVKGGVIYLSDEREDDLARKIKNIHGEDQ